MSQPWDHVPAWAAEFPSDNPALHEGVSWVCLSVCGPAKPIARPRVSGRIALPSVIASRAPVHPTSAVVAEPEALVPAVAPLDAITEVSPSHAGATTDVLDASLSLHLDEDVAAALELALLPGEPFEPEAASAVVASGSDDPATDSSRSELPASVLRVLLERLDFELTPAAGAVTTEAAAMTEPLDLDPSDLDGGSDPPLEGNPATSESGSTGEPSEGVGASRERHEELVFDGGFDTGASETTGERAAEDVLAVVLERHDEVITSDADVGSPVADAPPAADAPPESEKPTAFHAFVGALVEVLLASGATRAAAVLPAVLNSSGGGISTLDAEARSLLITAGVADDTDGRVRLREGFVATARAWRDVLSGATNDLSACGTTTLDGWAADLLRAFGVGRDGRDVKRELRRRGVAAFGMLLAA